jgi:heat shock protein HslJ
LSNKDWRLVELNARPTLVAGGANDPFIRFEVDSSRVTGHAGCNRFFGGFTYGEGQSLHFSALGSTRMACVDANRNQQEIDFMAALSSTQRYSVTGDTLTLFGPAGSVAKLVARQVP